MRYVISVFAVVAAALLPARTSVSAEYYWDLNGATPGAGSTPTGTWNNTDANWTTDQSGSSPTVAISSPVGLVHFVSGPSHTSGNNPYTVTISGTQTTGGLDFGSSGAATLSGGAINLRGSGRTIYVSPYAYLTPYVATTGPVTINTPILVQTDQSFANASINLLTISGGLAGMADLTLGATSSGGIALPTANAYAGTIRLVAGTIIAGNKDAFGSGTISFEGGTLANSSDLSGTNAIPNNIMLNYYGGLAGQENMTLSGTLTLYRADRTLSVNDPGLRVLSGNVYLSDSADSGHTLILDGSGHTTITGTIANYSGSLSMAGGLTYRGTGTLTLQAANTYSGTTTLNFGTVVAANKDVFGTSTIALCGGSLAASTDLSGPNAIANKVTLNFGNLSNLAGGILGGSNNMTINGTVTNSGGNSTLTVNNTAATLLSGDVYLSAASATSGTLILNGTGNVTLSGCIANYNGSPGTLSKLTYSGTGILTLQGASIYSGTTVLSSGTLNLNNPGTDNTNSAIGTSTLVLNGGTLDNTTGSAVVLKTNNPVTLGSFTFGGTNALDLGIGPVTNNGCYTITLNGNNPLTFGGAMSNMYYTDNILTVNNGAGTGPGTALNLGGYTLAGKTNVGRQVIAGNANINILGPVANGVPAAQGLTYNGTGTLTFRSASPATYTGTMRINSGTVMLDFSNLSSAANLLDSSSALALGGGTLKIVGQSGAATTQSLVKLTLYPGQSAILLTDNGATSTTLNLGPIVATGTSAAGSALMVNAYGQTVTTTTAQGTNGTYGPRIIFSTAGSADWTTSDSDSSPYALSAYSGYAPFVAAAGSSSTNYALTGSSSLIDNANFNSLKITVTAAGQALDLGPKTLTLTNGGLLFTGPNDYTISGTAGLAHGTSGGEYIFEHYGTGNLTVNAPIVANGVNALTKAGPGTLTLTGPNTYTGQTYISGGTLNIGANSALGAEATAAQITIQGGTLQAGASFKLDDGNGHKRGLSLYPTGGTIDTQGYTLTVSGSISDSGSLKKLGLGTLVLSGYNSSSGPFYIQNGTLQCGGTQPLNLTNTVVLGADSTNGTLDLNGGTVSVGGLAVANGAAAANQVIGNSSTTAAATLTFGGTESTFGGSIQDTLGGGNSTVALNVTAGTLTLTGTNSYSGGTTVNSLGTLVLAGPNTGTGPISINGAYSILVVASGGSIGNAPVKLTSGTLILQTPGAITNNTLFLARTSTASQFTETVDNAISGTAAVTVSGSPVIRLSRANNYRGPTTVIGGGSTVGQSLLLDFSQPGAPFSNIINNGISHANIGTGSTLILTGSYLGTKGMAGTANTQEFNGLTLNPGPSGIMMSFSAPLTGSVGIALNAITREPGSVIDFTIDPTHTVSTTTPNANLAGGQQTILGGWATVGSGDSWAVSGSGSAPGTITSLLAYTPNTSNVLPAGADIDMSVSGGAAVSSTTTINSLRFNAYSTAQTVTIGSGNILTIATGGILQTSGVQRATETITGGSITSGNGADLIVMQNDNSLTAALAIDSAITDNGITPIALTLAGSGTIRLGGNNTFTGGVFLSGSAVVLTNANALGQAGSPNALTFGYAGAGLQLNGNSVTVASLDSTPAVLQSADYNVTIQNGGATDATLTINGSATTTFAGVLRDGYGGGKLGVTLQGGSLTLTRKNDYTGTTTLTGGTLILGSNQAIGPLALNGGTLQASVNGGVTIKITTSLTGNSTVSGDQKITFNLGTFTNKGGDYMLTSSIASPNNLTISCPVYLSESNSNTRTLTINGTGNTTISGVIANNSGVKSLASNLTYSGTGTLTLQGANTYTGTTTIDSGTLVIDSFGYNGSIASASVVNNGTLVFYTYTAQSSSAAISGSGTLSKTGTGTLTLGGANTYSGDTTVGGGTLFVTGTGSLSFAVSDVFVRSGARLGGSGAIGRAIAMDLGSTLVPGNDSSIGTLTLGSGGTINGTYRWKLAALYDDDDDGTPGTNFDNVLLSSGSLSGINPTFSLAFLNSTSPSFDDPFWNSAHTWTIIDNTGTGTLNFTGISLNGYGTNGVGANGAFSVTVGSGPAADAVLSWSPVPEPSTLVLLGTGVLGMFAYAWRRGRVRPPWKN